MRAMRKFSVRIVKVTVVFQNCLGYITRRFLDSNSSKWKIDMSDSSKNKKPESDRKYEAKTRKCLMCRTEFKSSWPGERVCSNCKQTSAWNEPSIAA